ncbi:MAG: adenylate/guanylate cyclase domain-containing protein [Anaerolineae bacterium]|nr:adenylate/guanylate cyclase domain-containing protein [Anaerolineae bacterium]
MDTSTTSPLATIEPRLRTLLPADLYATAWLDPSAVSLQRVFEHLRTLQRILYNYVPRHVSEVMPHPGDVRFEWQAGTLMFTDLAGFTPLMEANAKFGKLGAKTLLTVLNTYFAKMIDIINKSGGNLLEFTGDALLAEFLPDQRRNDVVQAVRAGLRMQRAMAAFNQIETDLGTFSLGMRIGIHTGRFLRADIGTPRRMDHVLLGHDVQATKLTEGAGKRGRVNLSMTAYERIKDQFHVEDGEQGYKLVIDDLSDEQLGEFDIAPAARRMGTQLLLDRSVDGLLNEITSGLRLVEPLAAYVPMPILNLLVENTARREIPPDFLAPTIVFVNLIGLSEAIEAADADEIVALIAIFSRIFTMVNAAVETRGGVLKKVTYHLSGSDIMIYFGAPQSHSDDPVRASEAALAIRDIIENFPAPVVGGQPQPLRSKIGLSRGSVFAAEIGEPRGRREFNILSDAVNTAARLMARAELGQILMTGAVQSELGDHFETIDLGSVQLKGKAAPQRLFTLVGHTDNHDS